MIVLGIESTAHTFSVAIVKKSKELYKTKKTASGAKVERQSGSIEVLANASDKYASTLEGYIPRKLADHHTEVFARLLQQALTDSRISISKIDAIAFSQGSGIGHCLHVGYVAAKTLSTALKVPLVPVSHSISHIEIGREFNCETSDPLVVYVSGGNTQILSLDKKNSKYHVYGETTDIGIGNFLDVLGRKLELKPSDAVGVVNAAQLASKYVEMPYTIRGMNLAFSGLLTYIEKKLIPQIKTNKLTKEEIAFSSQETAFAMLCEAVERALCHTNKKEILLCGGNARNARLQEMLKEICREHNVHFACTSFEYSGDQAAMIALTGIKMLESKCLLKCETPAQRLRTDVTHVCW